MKRIIFLVLVFILVAAIVNVAFSLVTLWGKRDLLTQTRTQLAKEQEENKNLKEAWGKVNDPLFIEEEARNKLFLGKPGESIVLIPTASPSGSIRAVQTNLPIWQQWLGLFF